MKHFLCFAAAAIAVCLMTPAAYAQRSDLDLRFHASFPFSVGNNTFAAGDYKITRQAKWTFIFWDGGNRAAKLVNVRPASVTVAPSAASMRALASPMPLPQPTTSARISLRGWASLAIALSSSRGG